MDCLEGHKLIDDKSIDMILTDLPYETTNCKWDKIIPPEIIWEQYKRIIKDNGAIVLTANQPFTSKLVMSNLDMFKYEWIWNKVKPGNIFSVQIKPLIQHESILVFGRDKVNYYPIMSNKNEIRYSRVYSRSNTQFTGIKEYNDRRILKGKYPKTILQFSNANQTKRVHPTQKPVSLFEYLIKTYTNEGDLVLDSCMGSGTTAIACLKIHRNYIGFELEKEYFDTANNRINEYNKQVRFI